MSKKDWELEERAGPDKWNKSQHKGNTISNVPEKHNVVGEVNAGYTIVEQKPLDRLKNSPTYIVLGIDLEGHKTQKYVVWTYTADDEDYVEGYAWGNYRSTLESALKTFNEKGTE